VAEAAGGTRRRGAYDTAAKPVQDATTVVRAVRRMAAGLAVEGIDLASVSHKQARIAARLRVRSAGHAPISASVAIELAPDLAAHTPADLSLGSVHGADSGHARLEITGNARDGCAVEITLDARLTSEADVQIQLRHELREAAGILAELVREPGLDIQAQQQARMFRPGAATEVTLHDRAAAAGQRELVRELGPAVDTGQLDADPGVASIVLACVNDAVAAPPGEALAWHRGDAPGLRQAAGQVEIEAAGGHATVPRDDLRAALAAAYAARLSHAGSWLFRADPLACVASHGDRRLGEQLEARLASFEAALATGELDDARASARRRIILAELRAAALLDEPLLDRKIEVLGELGLTRLGSYAAAARDLLAYYASSERARYARHPPPRTIHEGVLSLDWARSVKPPPGIAQYSVWCVCEDSFRSSPPTEDSGRKVLGVGRLRAWLYWRVEDGTRRMLYAASLTVT